MPEDTDPMTTSASNNVRNLRPVAAPRGQVLRIVSGLHAGASRALAEQEMLVVGSGDDCDIVLADTGVAAHHALITLVGGSFTLRALDAPLRIEGKPLHPGDPVEVRPLQRIDLGEASIAFGEDDEAAWDALFPAIAGPARRHRARPLLRRLPMIAAVAVLAVAAVAAIAAFLPRQDNQVDASAFLQALIPQHAITDAKVSQDVNGVPALSGTVGSVGVRQRIEQQVRDAGVQANLSLRTGDDLARDVREVFRMAGIAVETKYVDGAVEINGEVEKAAFQDVLRSRALADVGVKVAPGGALDEAGAQPQAQADPLVQAAAQPPVDIVAVVRGRQPYVVDSNGVQYPDGSVIPGHGKLVGIASKIYVQGANGEIRQIRPITAAELAARAAAANFEGVTGTPGAVPANAAQTTTQAQAAPTVPRAEPARRQ
jgi:hypothetical protein